MCKSQMSVISLLRMVKCSRRYVPELSHCEQDLESAFTV